MESVEEIVGQPAPAERLVLDEAASKRSWRSALDKLSYNGIVHNIPFMLFVAMLCVLYIANTSRAVSLTREISKQKEEVKELRWQYLDIQATLMKATSESELTKRAAAIGLKPLDKPPFEIDLRTKTATVTTKQ